MSAAEGASKASSPEQVNEWAVRANERTDERVAQYSMSLFLNHSAHRAAPPPSLPTILYSGAKISDRHGGVYSSTRVTATSSSPSSIFAILARNVFIASQQLALLRPSSEKDKWGGDPNEENVRVFLHWFKAGEIKHQGLGCWIKHNGPGHVESNTKAQLVISNTKPPTLKLNTKPQSMNQTSRRRS